MQVAIVNYELVANSSNRFLVGLILPDNRLVDYGTVQMRFKLTHYRLALEARLADQAVQR